MTGFFREDEGFSGKEFGLACFSCLEQTARAYEILELPLSTS
jgi:hypothetical protein